MVDIIRPSIPVIQSAPRFVWLEEWRSEGRKVLSESEVAFLASFLYLLGDSFSVAFCIGFYSRQLCLLQLFI